MYHSIQNFSVISILSFTVIVGLLIFSKGFLLNRQIILEKSNPCWNQDSKSNLSNNTNVAFESTLRSLSSASSWCNPAPIFPKLVIILVDALRHDFVARMKFLSKIVDDPGSYPSQSDGISSCMFKFLADPPTTTMQRLKALMTGTMPTFIDASANFNSNELEEDSLIYQLFTAGKRIAFLGDDTWLNLFPKRFFTSRIVEGHPSFNAWDLDTVDRAVNSTVRRLFSPEEKENNEWDVLITHILGVDHCGHRYGPNHPEMKRKLDEADEMIEFVFNAMSHETLLVVFGDHGMTKTGDHGGDSSDEVGAALVFLTKQLKRRKEISPPFQCHSSGSTSVSQIDLVPTLASMLGIPIPYSNIGQIIPDFLMTKVYSDGIAANVAQVQKYIQRYSSATGTNLPGIAHGSSNGSNLYEQYTRVEEAFMEYQASRNPSTRSRLHQLAENYLRQVKAIATSAWTQFDVLTIYTGLFISLLSVINLSLHLSYEESLRRAAKRNGLRKFTIVSWLWPSLAHWTAVFNYVFGWASAASGILVSTISGLLVFFFAIFYKTTMPVSDDEALPSKIRRGKKRKSIGALVGRSTLNWSFNLMAGVSLAEFGSKALYAFTCLSVFSNSFVINEGYILGSILLGVLLLNLLCSFPKWDCLTEEGIKGSFKKNKCIWSCFFVLTVIVRSGHIFFRCREELTDCQEGFLLHKQLSSLPADWIVHKYVRYGVALLALAVFVVFFRNWMMHRKCLANSRPASIVAKYIPILLVVIICVYWALQGLPFIGAKIKPLNNVPWVFQLVILISIVVIWVRPLCCVGSQRFMYNVIKKRKGSKGNKRQAEQMKYAMKNIPSPPPKNGFKTNGFVNHANSFNNHKDEKKANGKKNFTKVKIHDEDDKRNIYDLMSNSQSEDVFSSSFLTHGALITLFLVQVSSAGITPAITMVAYSAVAIIGFFRCSASQLKDSWAPAITWTLASQYFFYATGHQPVFSAIPWDSAFIGTNEVGNIGESWINMIRPGAAVVGNLYVSQIIFSTFVPLMVYWSVDKKKPESQFGPKEKHSAFIFAGKFICLHAFKLISCMFCAAWHRRHLMVWMIFAPKFIFEMISFIITLSIVTLSLVLLTRISYLFHKLSCVSKSDETEAQTWSQNSIKVY